MKFKIFLPIFFVNCLLSSFAAQAFIDYSSTSAQSVMQDHVEAQMQKDFEEKRRASQKRAIKYANQILALKTFENRQDGMRAQREECVKFVENYRFNALAFYERIRRVINIMGDKELLASTMYLNASEALKQKVARVINLAQSEHDAKLFAGHFSPCSGDLSAPNSNKLVQTNQDAEKLINLVDQTLLRVETILFVNSYL